MASSSYISSLRNIQSLLMTHANCSTINTPTSDIQADIIHRRPTQIDVPILRIPFPEDLTPLITSLGLTKHITDRLSQRLQEQYCSMKELQSKHFRQSCHEIMPWLSNDDAMGIIEKLRLSYENMFVNQYLTQIRSDLLLMKARLPMCSPPKKRPFNTQYLPLLERFFASNAYPSVHDRLELSHKTMMTPRQIEVWFQNHRRRARQEGRAIKRLSSHRSSSEFLKSLEDGLSPFNFADEDRSMNDDTLSDDDTCDDESATKSPNFDPLETARPQYAFPTTYPPRCADPFPNNNGIFKFQAPVWWRKPATNRPTHTVVDMDNFTRLFASKLHLRGNCIKQRQTSKLFVNPSCDKAWYDYRITVAPPAPHPALIRTNRPLQAVASNSLLGPFPSLGRMDRISVQKKPHALPSRWPSHLSLPCTGNISTPSAPRSKPSFGSVGSRSRLSSSSSISSSGPTTPPLSPSNQLFDLQFSEEDILKLDEFLGITRNPPTRKQTSLHFPYDDPLSLFSSSHLVSTTS